MPGCRFASAIKENNPTLITQVANQIANLFIEENLRTRERQAEGTADFIDSQLGEAKKKLDQLESKLSAYKVQYNGELPQQEGFLTSTLDRFQTELHKGNQDAINRAQQNRLMLQNTLSMAEAEETVLALRQRQAKSDEVTGVAAAERAAAPSRTRDPSCCNSNTTRIWFAISRTIRIWSG